MCSLNGLINKDYSSISRPIYKLNNRGMQEELRDKLKKKTTYLRKREFKKTGDNEKFTRKKFLFSLKIKKKSRFSGTLLET